MDSAAWGKCEDARLMLDWWVNRQASAERPIYPSRDKRKLRLFAAACCRQAWHLLADGRSRAAVEVAERYADGEATERERFRAWDEAIFAVEGVVFAAARCADDDEHIHLTPTIVVQALVKAGVQPVALAGILRDIFGDPHRPVAAGPACPAWRTPAVSDLAAAAYEHRSADGTLDNFRLALVADALEEAGCAGEVCPKCRGSGTYTVQVANQWLSAANGYSPSTTYSEWRGCRHCGGDHDRKGAGRVAHPALAHLRSAGPHWRGCHALDAVLGKA